MTRSPASPLRPIVRDCLFILLLAVVPAGLTGWFHPQAPAWSWHKPEVAEVELTEVLHWQTPVLWIDARSKDAYEVKHVPGAISLNEEHWEQQLPSFLAVWRPEARIVVYCDSTECDASRAVALRLQRELKLTEIQVLTGGWAAWNKDYP